MTDFGVRIVRRATGALSLFLLGVFLAWPWGKTVFAQAADKGAETATRPLAAVAMQSPRIEPAAGPSAGSRLTTTETMSVVDAQALDVLTTTTLTPDAIIRLTSPPQTVALKGVTLGDVILLTLQRNLDFKIAQINYQIAQDEVKAQWGMFDPLLIASVEARDVTQQGSIFNALMGGANTGLTGSRTAAAMATRYEEGLADVRRQSEQDQQQEPTIEQLLQELRQLEAQMAQGFASDYRSINRMKTRSGSLQMTEENGLGGTIGAGGSISRAWMQPAFVNINPAYSDALSIWLVQPLPFFRNWGPTVTLSAIRLAEKNERSRQWDKRLELLTQMARVTAGYWDLVFTIYNAEVQRLSLESARSLLRINEIRLEHEVGTEIDVWEARAGVALRENGLIRAAQMIGLAQDNLARLTRVNETPDWKVRMIPRDMPSVPAYPVDESKFIAEALERRPDIQQARLMQERAQIRRKVARNQRMPRLDFFGQYGVTGLGPDTGRAGHNLGTLDYDNWDLGLDLSLPLPNTRARARARQADKLVEGSALLIEQLKDFATFEVRKAIRDLQTARDSIEVGQTRVRAEQEKLRGEMKRYEVGMATSQDLLDYQDRLAAAQSNLIGSIVEYNKAIIDLERARGTLLEYLKMILPELPAAAPMPTE